MAWIAPFIPLIISSGEFAYSAYSAEANQPTNPSQLYTGPHVTLTPDQAKQQSDAIAAVIAASQKESDLETQQANAQNTRSNILLLGAVVGGYLVLKKKRLI